MNRWWNIPILLLAVAAGCARTVYPAPLSDRIEPRLYNGAPVTHYRDIADIEHRPPVDLPADAHLEDFVAVALAHNPRIAAARFELQRLEQRIPQETSLDDPMLGIAPMGRTWHSDVNEVMIEVSQTIPFAGKRATRGDIARRQVAIAAANYRQVQLEVAADVRRAYWSLYRTQQSLEIRQQTRQLLQQFQASAQANFRAGNVSQQDVLRASVELAELDREVADLHQQRESAIAMLNTLMNRDPEAPLPPIIPADPVKLELRTQDLLAAAWQTNPTIEQAHQQIESARLQQKLARLSRWPDFTIGVGYNIVDEGMDGMSSDDEWTVSLSINLPIWFDRLRAAERESLFARYSAIADLAAERNDISFRIHDAITRIRSQQQQIQLLRDRILPEARQTVQASAGAYRAGHGSFVELLDNWRTLLAFEQMYHDNLTTLQQTVADLEQIIGQPIRNLDDASINPTQPANQP